MNHNRYWLGHTAGGKFHEHEATKEEYVRYERAAGFRNTLGQPDEPATAGFSGGGLRGRLEYRTCRARQTEQDVLEGRELDHTECLAVD